MGGPGSSFFGAGVRAGQDLPVIAGKVSQARCPRQDVLGLICLFHVFVTKGVKLKGGAQSGASNEAEIRYVSFWFRQTHSILVRMAHKCRTFSKKSV